jgi:hypothetical protein
MESDLSRPGIVAAFEKNSREEVRISIDEFHGRKLINMRVFYRSESGTWLPGKQGLAIGADLYRDLASALVKVGEALKAGGSI